MPQTLHTQHHLVTPTPRARPPAPTKGETVCYSKGTPICLSLANLSPCTLPCAYGEYRPHARLAMLHQPPFQPPPPHTINVPCVAVVLAGSSAECARRERGSGQQRGSEHGEMGGAAEAEGVHPRASESANEGTRERERLRASTQRQQRLVPCLLQFDPEDPQKVHEHLESRLLKWREMRTARGTVGLYKKLLAKLLCSSYVRLVTGTSS